MIGRLHDLSFYFFHFKRFANKSIYLLKNEKFTSPTFSLQTCGNLNASHLLIGSYLLCTEIWKECNIDDWRYIFKVPLVMYKLHLSILRELLQTYKDILKDTLMFKDINIKRTCLQLIHRI